jgi:GTP-binding protein Era
VSSPPSSSGRTGADSSTPRTKKSGFVALIGRPNAGKSTLLNRLVGEKLAIVSDKPQTTRNRILGARTYEDGQIVFVDTPGVHRPLHRLNVRMVDAALDALQEVDLVVVVVDASEPSGGGDRFLMDVISKSNRPRILALNKVDLVEKPKLLPTIERYHREVGFVEIVPLSAKTGENVDRLERVVVEHLPEGEPLYPEDFLTDQPERFFVAELVREQVLRETHAELPFSTAVVVDKFEEPDERGLMRLYCSILVDRESQKPILVGRQGSMIKRIGTAARQELERFFDAKVFLDLHVKVREDWREDERVLDELGLPAARRRRGSGRSRRP